MMRAEARPRRHSEGRDTNREREKIGHHVHSNVVAISAALMVSLLIAGCGGAKRPTDNTRTPSGQSSRNDATDTGARPPQPIEEGPDVRAIESEGSTGRDLETGEEASALVDIQFDYDQASLTDAARVILEKHSVWLQTH